MSKIQALFTANNVFKNAKVNSVCDQVLRTIDKYRLIDTVSDFAFYGEASIIYQGASTKEVGIIQFITGRSRLYRIIIEKLAREVKVKEIIAYKEAIYINIDGVQIEVVKSPNVIQTVSQNGILCYNYTAGAQDNAPLDPDAKPSDADYGIPIVPNANYTINISK